MLSKILISLALLIVGLVVFVLLRPSGFTLTCSITISAPASTVFPQVNDLHRYNLWNPFRNYDPAMHVTFEGPASGPGAILNWAGNSKVGAGKMAITDHRPNELVVVRLDFLKPFASTARTEFTLTPEQGSTRVTWTMSGQRTFMPKLVGVFITLDEMIGGDFAKGLAELKSLVESPGS